MTTSATSGFGTLLKIGDGGVGAGVKSFKTWGSSNTSIRLRAKVAGAAGNGRSITVVSSGSSYVFTTVTASTISITIPTTATVAQVLTQLYQIANFVDYWEGDYNAVGDGSGVCPAQTVTTTAGGSDGTEVFTTVAEVKSLSGPNLAAAVIDVTSMDSANNTREFITSLIDPGELSFQVNFLPGLASQQALVTDMKNRTRRNFKIVWTDTAGTTWSFAGIITSFQPSSATEEALSASVTIKVTGFPTWV